MKVFRDLVEAARMPEQITWRKQGKEWIGEFFAKDQKFDILITKLSKCDNLDVIQFKFYRNQSTKMYNDMKYPFQVYPTIKYAIDLYVKTAKPDILLFMASDDSKARKAAYKLESGNLATKYNYHDITSLHDENDVLFGLIKKYEYVECIKELIGL